MNESSTRADSERTHASLLIRLRDARDTEAWRQFVEVYTPVVFSFARRKGLQEADAADLSQEVMCTVAKAMKGFAYDPARGRFRHWLLTVVRSKYHDFIARRQQLPVGASESTLEHHLNNEAAAAEHSNWEVDYHRRVFKWASTRIRSEFQDSTWQAFWRTAVDGEDGKEVAAALGMSIGAVYVAKSRVTARLKEEVGGLSLESSDSV